MKLSLTPSAPLRIDLFIIVLTGAVLLNNLLWSLTIPFNNAPDEYDHYRLAKFISEEGRLPVLRKDMNYYFMSIATKFPAAEEEFKWRREHEALFPQFLYEFKPLYVAWPCGPHVAYAIFLTVAKVFPIDDFYFARFFSVICGGLIVFFLYDLTKRIMEEGWLSKAVAVFAGFLPQVTFLSAYINPDIVTALAVTMVLWCWEYADRKRRAPSALFLLGLTLGALAMSKISGYSAGIAAILFTALFFRKRKVSFKSGLALLSGIFIVSGWFFIRNFIIYRDASGYFANMNAMKSFFLEAHPFFLRHDIFSAIDRGFFQWPFAYLVKYCFFSFWGVFGWMANWMPKAFYLAAFAVTILAAAGLLKKQGRTLVCGRFGQIALAIFIVQIISVALYVWMIHYQPQGKYFVAIIAPIAFLFCSGFFAWAENERQRRFLFWIFSFMMVAMNIWAFILCILLQQSALPPF